MSCLDLSDFSIFNTTSIFSGKAIFDWLISRTGLSCRLNFIALDITNCEFFWSSPSLWVWNTISFCKQKSNSYLRNQHNTQCWKNNLHIIQFFFHFKQNFKDTDEIWPANGNKWQIYNNYYVLQLIMKTDRLSLNDIVHTNLRSSSRGHRLNSPCHLLWAYKVNWRNHQIINSW